MRLVTFRGPDGRIRAGRVEGDAIVELQAPDVGALLGTPRWKQAARKNGAIHAVAGVALLPVVPRPSKILCVGLNFRSHIEEAGLPVPQYPTLFAKFARALTGPYEPIQIPHCSTQVDWEAELAVIVGDQLYNGDRTAAGEAIAGYTIMNDISMRDWQFRTSQWLQGKNFECSTPLGPALVSIDEVGPQPDLEVICTVNDEVMQHAQTGDLVFNAAEVLSYVSTFITLEPGDIVALGTPGGVGAAMQPQRFLSSGDRVITSISGLGELNNTIAVAP